MRPTAFELALLAECYSPDSGTSDGAEFLIHVWDAWEEQHLQEWYVGDPDAARCELANDAVPHVTVEKWAVFTDLGAYTKLSEVEDSFGKSLGFDETANETLFIIAHRLLKVLDGSEWEDEE